MTISCAEDSGNLKSLKGTIQVLDPSGKTSELLAGQEYPIKVETAKEAPATAAGEAPGGPPAGGDLGDVPPPDSRDIQTSPSQ